MIYRDSLVPSIDDVTSGKVSYPLDLFQTHIIQELLYANVILVDLLLYWQNFEFLENIRFDFLKEKLIGYAG